jgi:hypothetical protein
MPVLVEEQVIETLFAVDSLNSGVMFANGFAAAATFSASTSWVIVYNPTGI